MKSLLLGSNWIAKPADDSHLVGLAFRSEYRAHVTVGFGQTLYFVAGCAYELPDTSTLHFTYDSSPERLHPSSTFTQGASLAIPFTLETGVFSGTVVHLPFTYLWRLRFERHPFPDGIFFPRPFPNDFYGYSQKILADVL